MKSLMKNEMSAIFGGDGHEKAFRYPQPGECRRTLEPCHKGHVKWVGNKGAVHWH